MKKKPKYDLEQIMEKIREYEQENGNTKYLGGFGMLKIVSPALYLKKLEKTNGEYREYTDNNLAGEWFTKYVKPQSYLKFIYPQTKIAVNNG